MSEAPSSVRVFLLHLVVGIAFATSGLFLSAATYVALWGVWGAVDVSCATARRESYVLYVLVAADLGILTMAFLVLPGATS